VLSTAVDALRAHAAEKDYLPAAGILPLRQEIHREHGLEFDPDRIIGAFFFQILFFNISKTKLTILLPRPSVSSFDFIHLAWRN
jgi:hypothetical protein